MLEIDAGRCTGCRLCELACSFSKEGVFAPARSRIRVHRRSRESVSVPLVCLQCDGRHCIEECPVGALAWDDARGVVSLDASACKNSTPGIRCRVCVQSCPFEGARAGAGQGPHGAGRHLPLFCDLCGGEPECARACLPGALRSVESRPAPEETEGGGYADALMERIVAGRAARAGGRG